MNAVLRLGGFEITSIEHSGGAVRIGPAIAGRSPVRIAAGTSCREGPLSSDGAA